jgi:hypothetical protein
MASFEIIGGKKLSGEVIPQGAKNEALQIISAVLLTQERVVISNLPTIRDVMKLIELLETMGVSVSKIDDHTYAFEAKDVNLEYYKSHFHIQDAILLNEHERKAHTRLIFSIINPIFERSTRFILKELMRLSANTCLYFEIHDQTVIPTIFTELVHVRSRRFPHFLDRKWDHERYVPPQQQNGYPTPPPMGAHGGSPPGDLQLQPRVFSRGDFFFSPQTPPFLGLPMGDFTKSGA